MNQFSYYRKRLYLLLSLMLISSVYGCINPLEKDRPISTTISPSLIPNSTAVILPSFTPSPTSSQPKELQQTCLFLQTPPHSLEAELNDIIVTFSIDNPNYFLDLEKNETFPIPFSLSDHKLFGGSISPNGQQIAFEVDRLDNKSNVIERRLIILDAYGQQKAAIPWMENWGVIRGWLDDNHLFIDGNAPRIGTIFIVNPITGEVQEFSSTIPNIYDEYPPAIWSVMPNSDLTLAVYPNSTSQEEGVGYSLWNTVTQKKIWHQDSITAPSILPFWSSDWMQFGVIVEESVTLENQSEILILDSFGRSVVQTDFSSNYSYVFIGNYVNWSPDGRYLFFWLSIGSSDNPPQTTSLAMLDLKEKTVTDLCIKSYGSGNKLIWVRDGEWLITWSDEAASNILINLLENEAYIFPIPVNRPIDGWMIKPNP